jgi:hypothetical protein
MPDPTKITDHVEQAKARMLTQFRDSPKLNALLEALVIEVQLSEDVIFDVILLRYLDAATGVNLDIIGRIVGRERLDVTDDDEYRELLRVQIRANQTDCGAEDIIYVASELTGLPVRYTQTTDHGAYAAHFHLEVLGGQGIGETELARIDKMIELVACAGVSWEFVSGSATNAFTYNTGPGYDYDGGEYGRTIGSYE